MIYSHSFPDPEDGIIPAWYRPDCHVEIDWADDVVAMRLPSYNIGANLQNILYEISVILTESFRVVWGADTPPVWSYSLIEWVLKYAGLTRARIQSGQKWSLFAEFAEEEIFSIRSIEESDGLEVRYDFAEELKHALRRHNPKCALLILHHEPADPSNPPSTEGRDYFHLVLYPGPQYQQFQKELAECKHVGAQYRSLAEENEFYRNMWIYPKGKTEEHYPWNRYREFMTGVHFRIHEGRFDDRAITSCVSSALRYTGGNPLERNLCIAKFVEKNFPEEEGAVVTCYIAFSGPDMHPQLFRPIIQPFTTLSTDLNRELLLENRRSPEMVLIFTKRPKDHYDLEVWYQLRN